MIHFTKHAREKFKILERHGFKISRHEVLRTVAEPDLIDYSRWPLKIAQRNFDKTHVLRVVFKEEKSGKIIITFYTDYNFLYWKKNPI